MQRKRLFISFLAAVAALPAAAQTLDSTSLHPITMDEFVISASKYVEHKQNVAQHIETITRKEIEWAMQPSSAGLLEQTGEVFVQRSQMGGGSPNLRGFEANRILLVVDGVRMNNAIYRGGHLQNVITIDNNMLDRVEILYGSASTLYGSDALGGVIVFNTRKPQFAERGTLFTGSVMTRYSSAMNEGTGHVDFNIAGRRFASVTSVTYSRFGDLRQGAFRNPFYGDFGLRNEYVARVNGQDIVVPNTDPNVQKNTGYSQVDVLQKFSFKQSEKVRHNLNLQYSTSSDIPRYDRLTDRRNGNLRYAEWYYGPQTRYLAAYQLEVEDAGRLADNITFNLNYQNIEESRHQRLFGDDLRESRNEKLDVIGYDLNMRKFLGKKHELTVGIDGQYNKVNSEGIARNIVNDTTAPLDTRYPDGGSNMFYGALYAQHIMKLIPNKLVLNDGVRLNYVSLNADFEDTTFFNFPFRDASQQNTALSGNLGLIYTPVQRWRFTLNGSTGFRSPNIDDLGKVFDTRAGSQIVIPNTDLEPEYTYTADLGITYGNEKDVKIEVNGFYTWFQNAIVLDKFTLNGEDSIMYQGQLTEVVANQNKARAYLYGFNASLTAHLMPRVTLFSSLNYTYGRFFDANDVEVPLDHIPPVFGKTSIMYRQKSFEGEIFALYNGWKRLKDYSPSGEDNLNYATPLGMPSWFTLNARAGFDLTSNIRIQLALENILDYNYRVFASGVSAPGRNFVVTIRGRF